MLDQVKTGGIEEEQVKNRLLRMYGIDALDITGSDMGTGSVTYIVNSKEQKYVMKYFSENSMNHPEIEPDLCKFLCEHEIPACQIVPNLQGKQLSLDETGRQFHVQRFVEGEVYHYNEAPEWLVKATAGMLGKIHKELEQYENLPEGIGENFFKYTSVEQTQKSYENTIKMAKEKGEELILDRIEHNLKVMKNMPDYSFDISELTIRNTHGDFNITQLICGNQKINAVIDWTSACRHPVVWEIMRSYVYTSQKCKDGFIDIDDFVSYVKEYMKFSTLNEYDLQNMGPLFFYFLAVCNFFGQYEDSITANREIYLQQAILSSKLLDWFSDNVDELTVALERLR